eukprot:gnl/MRDRNA2_/MRDRNA2_86281_c0_seq1.p1 gnl/MRDRNA2_/MRDRNA2_86281_c0~~gnl/MRDRNA2_/MRDRNA2_86281_c0_seq1.p1  ORF type:complete len:665 (+),score=112.94 gnl/MRDRNA2_/MRDRNA2_86281_c0_seq1:93-2087(+)
MQFFRSSARSKTLSNVEEVAVSKVCEAYSKVVSTCGSPGQNWDLHDPECAAACTEFLQKIDAASNALRVEAAARQYRVYFTVNYQILFPTDDRHYRLDILTACTEQYSGIWLNGERYDFQEDVTKTAEALMQAWTELLNTIGSLEPGRGEGKQSKASRVGDADSKQEKSELKTALRTFDEAWAQFEYKYIIGLMHIEDQAKKLLRDAIEQEGKLHEMERTITDSSSPQLDRERSEFVQCISQLNVVANTERKGRSDLTADILEHALMLWQGPEGAKGHGHEADGMEDGSLCNEDEECFTSKKGKSATTSMPKLVLGILKSVANSSKASQSAHTSSKSVRFFPEGEDNDACDDDLSNASTASTEDLSTVSGQQHKRGPIGDISCACLAGDVVESFWHIRYYLRDISKSLERIDPNLSSNSELVSRLEDWEESWEVGRDYVRDSGMLQIVCELVSFLKEAAKLEPAFAEMTQECGAEFCLCLPRLVWLHFLQDPQRHMQLLQRFLPHHFDRTDSQSSWSSSIHNLLRRYEEAEREVTQLSKRVADRECSVHRFLVQSVIAGPNSDVQPDFSAELDLGSKSDSHALVIAIEERSMELQRHEPAAWNHFMMVIVRCFSEGQPKRRQRMGPKAPVPKIQPTRSRRSLWRSRPRLRTMPAPIAIGCLSGN